jgi:hypothetical protein
MWGQMHNAATIPTTANKLTTVELRMLLLAPLDAGEPEPVPEPAAPEPDVGSEVEPVPVFVGEPEPLLLGSGLMPASGATGDQVAA